MSLEDIFNSATKKLKVQRKTYDSQTGKQSVEDKILSVPIKKGLKAGSNPADTAEPPQTRSFLVDVPVTLLVAVKAHRGVWRRWGGRKLSYAGRQRRQLPNHSADNYLVAYCSQACSRMKLLEQFVIMGRRVGGHVAILLLVVRVKDDQDDVLRAERRAVEDRRAHMDGLRDTALAGKGEDHSGLGEGERGVHECRYCIAGIQLNCWSTASMLGRLVLERSI